MKIKNFKVLSKKVREGSVFIPLVYRAQMFAVPSSYPWCCHWEARAGIVSAITLPLRLELYKRVSILPG